MNYIEFNCQSFKDNYEKILPFFLKYPILGVKAQDFEEGKKVAEMIKSKEHLTNEGFEQIRQIKARMNSCLLEATSKRHKKENNLTPSFCSFLLVVAARRTSNSPKREK